MNKNIIIVILAIAVLVLGADKLGKKPEDINGYLKQINDMSKTVANLQTLVTSCKK